MPCHAGRLYWENRPEWDEKGTNKSSVDAFMLGELMYIVPVLKIGVKKMGVYLPKGTWIHLWVGHGNSSPACLFAFMPGLMKAIYYRPESKLPIRKALEGQ